MVRFQEVAPIAVREWCNGNTTHFDCVVLGSSPSSRANLIICVNVSVLGGVIYMLHLQGDTMSPMLLQIKECLSRNLDAIEISRRLHIDTDYVRAAIEIINQLST